MMLQNLERIHGLNIILHLRSRSSHCHSEFDFHKGAGTERLVNTTSHGKKLIKNYLPRTHLQYVYSILCIHFLEVDGAYSYVFLEYEMYDGHLPLHHTAHGVIFLPNLK